VGKSRRRRRSARNDTVGGLVVIVVFLCVVGFVLSHPAILVAVGLLAAGGVTLFAAFKIGQSAIRVRENARIAQARREQYELDLYRYSHIEPYLTMGPAEFERALAFLCSRDGCVGAQVVGGAGDLGADVIATTPLGQRLVIQAKRYSQGNLVTGPDLQKFGGTCYAIHRADVAVVITTSDFTKQAREYAARTRIRLFDQRALAAWASHTGMPPWPSP
jgi:restriction system protein